MVCLEMSMSGRKHLIFDLDNASHTCSCTPCMCQSPHIVDTDAQYVTTFCDLHQGKVGQEAVLRRNQILTHCQQTHVTRSPTLAVLSVSGSGGFSTDHRGVAGTHFVDSTFDQTSLEFLSQRIYWKPPEDIGFPSEPNEPWVVYNGKPMPQDVIQGKLGNCWLLAALASLARFPSLVEKVLLTRDYCKEGVYAIQLCKNGIWTAIIIDDLLPCDRKGSLLFAKATNKQLWVPLIEKAIAKLHGSYESLKIGRCNEGLTQLTGMPSRNITFKDDDRKLRIDPYSLWKHLQESFHAKHLMCAETDGSSEKNDEKNVECWRIGLSPLHGYSVLDVQNKEGKKFIQLYDPRYFIEWKGSGSEYGNHEGVFWISFEDFLKYFITVVLCVARPSDFELRLKGSFPSSARDGNIKIWKLKVDFATEIHLGLFQQKQRGTANNEVLLDLRLVVLRDGNSAGVGIGTLVNHGVHHIAHFVEFRTVLDGGEYLLVPLAFKHWNDGFFCQDKHQYVISVHSSKCISCEEITVSKDHYGYALADTVIHLAVEKGHQQKIQSGVTRYFLLDSLGLIMVIENRKRLPLQVLCSNRKDTEIGFVSTRDTMTTIDVTPPRHRQVIMVLTRRKLKCKRKLQAPILQVKFKTPRPTDSAQMQLLEAPMDFLHDPRPL